MNIKQFKEGDIITRVEPCQYDTDNKIKDGSWCGERAILLGHDEKTKLIFLSFPDSCLNDEPHDLSYARDRWDEGWEYYPETMWQKLKKKFDKKLTTSYGAKNKTRMKLIIKLELTKAFPDKEPIWITTIENENGNYVGNLKFAERLIKIGINPELASPDNNVCSIGKSVKDGKWYGWSHRAIYGFQIGDKIKKGDCTASSGLTKEYLKDHPEENLALPIGFEAKTEEDAKRMAIAFADSVS